MENSITKSAKRKGTLFGVGGMANATTANEGEKKDEKGLIDLKARPTSSNVIHEKTHALTSNSKPATQSAHPPPIISAPKIESNVIKII